MEQGFWRVTGVFRASTEQSQIGNEGGTVKSDFRQTAWRNTGVLEYMSSIHHHKAETFRTLHQSSNPLLLANAWDAASAVLTEAAGGQAIATTSAGVAWSIGSPDGARMRREQAVSAVRQIAEAVNLPVTADIEDGYGNSADDVMLTVTEVIRAGAVGINIEDGMRAPDVLVGKIAAARQVANALNVDLFINARVDAFLTVLPTNVEEEARLIQEVRERAVAYIAAGADGIFVPGASHSETIRQLTQGIAAPVNIMVGPGALNTAELSELGVARVSLGSGIAQAAYAVASRAARELFTGGTYTSITGGIEYDEMNALLDRPSNRSTR